MKRDTLIEMKGISKRFGSVLANDNVDLDVCHGEIHALLGENGSGKSTLMNVLSGIYMPDQGSIVMEGRKKIFHSPQESIQANIGMIHQHFKLAEVLTATENIIAGSQKRLWIDHKKKQEEIEAFSQKYGLVVDLNKRVYEMSVSEKQTVEILKALYRGAKLLILDEPTAVLTPQETKVLFKILDQMRRDGCSMIIITHKLDEVLAISDRVTILRKGKSIGTLETKEADAKTLTRFMVGQEISLDIPRIAKVNFDQGPLVHLDHIQVFSKDKRPLLDKINLDLFAGEIHGIAGIAGSGQDILCETLSGIRKADSGTINYKGQDIQSMSVKERRGQNISFGFVPEDRLGMGLVPGMSIMDNVMLRFYSDDSGLFYDKKKAEIRSEEIICKYGVATSGKSQMIEQLSGGNMQKILLGREIDQNPDVLIVSYPVRGLDIGASRSVYEFLNEAKKQGTAILFIGEDLDVLLNLCDRISVMYSGKIVATLDGEKTDKETLGAWMMGSEVEINV